MLEELEAEGDNKREGRTLHRYASPVLPSATICMSKVIAVSCSQMQFRAVERVGSPFREIVGGFKVALTPHARSPFRIQSFHFESDATFRFACARGRYPVKSQHHI